MAENRAFFIRLAEGTAAKRLQRVTLADGSSSVAVVVMEEDAVESIDGPTADAVDRAVEPSRGY